MSAEIRIAGQVEEDRLKSVPRNAPVRIALFALRFYKTYLSLLFAGSCRFEPTCSQFMYQAIERYGVTRGVWLGTKRLLRCHPFSRKFGYDPVPEDWKGTSSHPETAASDVLGASHEESGLHESRVTSHKSPSSIHSCNFEIQNEVRS